MAKKTLTLKEQLDQVNALLENEPGNAELIQKKAEIEAKQAKVEAMQAGKKKDPEKQSNVFMINGKASKNMCLAEVWKLEKKPTNERTADGTVIHSLTEVKLIKTVKILREHLAIHKEQEANTLLRYKEVE